MDDRWDAYLELHFQFFTLRDLLCRRVIITLSCQTEFICLGTRQQLDRISKLPLTVGGQVVTPVQSARNLGVILDDQLKMDAHARSIVKSCFYQLRQLRSVLRSLTTEARRALVTAFIASRVDYCNAVFYGVAKSTIRRLQSCLNAAARLVTGFGKYNHITPAIRDILHWLPVEQRIIFKIAGLAFDCVRGTCPAYFSGVCNPLAETDGRSRLRSADRGLLQEAARGLRAALGSDHAQCARERAFRCGRGPDFEPRRAPPPARRPATA